MNDIEPTCDVCGAPATRMARDTIRVKPEIGARWLEHRFYGEDRYGCDKHPPAPPLVYQHDGKLLGRVTTDEGRPIIMED